MKYNELLQLWKQSNQDWECYKNDVASFIKDLHEKILNILETDKKFFNLVNSNPRKEMLESGLIEAFSPIDAIKIEDDGWISFQFFLLLENASYSPNGRTRYILNPCRIKKNIIENSWILKVCGNSSEYKIIPENYDKDIEEIIKSLIGEFVDRFEDQVYKWIDPNYSKELKANKIYNDHNNNLSNEK